MLRTGRLPVIMILTAATGLAAVVLSSHALLVISLIVVLARQPFGEPAAKG